MEDRYIKALQTIAHIAIEESDMNKRTNLLVSLSDLEDLIFLNMKLENENKKLNKFKSYLNKAFVSKIEKRIAFDEMDEYVSEYEKTYKVE